MGVLVEQVLGRDRSWRSGGADILVHQTRFPHATITQYDHLERANLCQRPSRTDCFRSSPVGERKLTFNKTFFRNDMAGDKSRYGRR